MTHCLNPVCRNPQNSERAEFCENCDANLLLGDRFRAIKVLGQGGFGRTFLAVDRDGRSRCVIKQVLPTLPHQSGKAVELFRQEAERLAELGEHPQIPQLLAHFEEEDGQYLVQEFVDGQNLEQILAKQGPFNEKQIRQILSSLLPVLEFIHSRRVIHRDIKPENILWGRGNQRLGVGGIAPNSLFLVDFGASKYASEGRATRTGTVIGSAGYAAPEQAMGKATFASDLYSLGVTCVHLLTGVHPFDLYSVGKDAWVWEQYLPEPIGVPLQRVLDKMLQRALGQRYRTATEVLQDLKLETAPAIALSIPPEALVSRAQRAQTVRLPRQASAQPLPELKLTTESFSSQPAIARAETGSRWEAVGTLLGHTGGVTALALSIDGRLLASGSTDRTIKLWDLPAGELLHTFGGRSLRFSGGHGDRITTLAFSPDGESLISGSGDGAIKFWDLLGHRLITTLPVQGWGIGAIAVNAGYANASSSGRPILASGDVDGQIDLWNLETGEPLMSLGKHRGQVSSLLLSPDGQTLISSSYDKTIRLWNLQSDAAGGNPQRVMGTLRGHTTPVNAMTITPDWRTLMSASQNGEVRFWDLNRRERGRTLMTRQEILKAIALTSSADGFPACLATGSEDGRINLWNVQPNDHGALTFAEAHPQSLFHTWAVNALVFSPDGRTLVSGSGDETIHVWRR